MSKYVKLLIVAFVAGVILTACDDSLHNPKYMDQQTMKPWDYCEKYPSDCE